MKGGEAVVNILLQRMVQHAYSTVPYYRKMFDEYGIDPLSIKGREDLKKLPILTKEQIQNDPEQFISENYLHYPGKKDLIIRRTSGSTGRFMKIYWTRQDDIRSKIHLWLIRSKVYGIDPSDRFCSFHTTSYINNRFSKAPETMLMRDGKNLSFSKIDLDMDKIESYYKQMLDFKPKWLFIQPSIAYLLADYVRRCNAEIPESLKYIELTGEVLFKNVRSKIADTFRTKIADQYGCNELNGLAMECSKGNLHILSNNVIIEALRDGKEVNDGEEGEIHITGLTNTAMPFIRYAIGDRGILSSEKKCGCGNVNPIISLLAGRESEFIHSSNGKILNCYVLLYPIEKINALMGGPVNQFQVVQESLDQMTVLLNIRDLYTSWKDSVIKEFVEYAEEAGLKNIKWKFVFVDKFIPDSKTGKLKFFISKIAYEGMCACVG
jgi:phenylacetate-CoA ligase